MKRAEKVYNTSHAADVQYSNYTLKQLSSRRNGKIQRRLK